MDVILWVYPSLWTGGLRIFRKPLSFVNTADLQDRDDRDHNQQLYQCESGPVPPFTFPMLAPAAPLSGQAAVPPAQESLG
jgi:hypothetical protein